MDLAASDPIARRRGRPPAAGLGRQQITARALELVEQEGIDGLSMRRLAASLGVSPMAIYGYFSGREELVDAMADELVGRVPLPSDGPWREEGERYAVAFHAVLLGHPALLALHATQPLTGPASVRAAQSLLGLLRRAGLGAREAVLSYQALSGYVYGTAITGSRERREAVAAALAELMGADAASPAAIAAADDEAFRFGLDLLLDGVARAGAEARDSEGR